MTVFLIIVLYILVFMWMSSGTFEIKTRDRLIRKLNDECEETSKNYNSLVKSYNDIIDFLEKHFTREELDELFLEHDIDNFLGENGNMNEQMREKIKSHLRDDLDAR